MGDKMWCTKEGDQPAIISISLAMAYNNRGNRGPPLTCRNDTSV